MNVAEVRKCLMHIRRAWDEHSITKPICLSTRMHNDMLFSEFSFHFIMGHHNKRHEKSRAAKRP